MFHKNVLNSLGSVSLQQIPESPQTPAQNQFKTPASPVRLALVPPGGMVSKKSSPLFDLIAIAAHRCSSFFAEAAVLVLLQQRLKRESAAKSK